MSNTTCFDTDAPTANKQSLPNQDFFCIFAPLIFQVQTQAKHNR